MRPEDNHMCTLRSHFKEAESNQVQPEERCPRSLARDQAAPLQCTTQSSAQRSTKAVPCSMARRHHHALMDALRALSTDFIPHNACWRAS